MLVTAGGSWKHIRVHYAQEVSETKPKQLGLGRRPHGSAGHSREPAGTAHLLDRLWDGPPGLFGLSLQPGGQGGVSGRARRCVGRTLVPQDRPQKSPAAHLGVLRGDLQQQGQRAVVKVLVQGQQAAVHPALQQVSGVVPETDGLDPVHHLVVGPDQHVWGRGGQEGLRGSSAPEPWAPGQSAGPGSSEPGQGPTPPPRRSGPLTLPALKVAFLSTLADPQVP